jgi:hypothetical protein
MIKNELRIGNFTSSEIVALTTSDRSGKQPGKPYFTYIDETNFERKLGRSITDEINARPLTWGKLLESRVFDNLGLEYVLTSNDTVQHPTIKYWAGSKDGIKYDAGKTVIDIKCPMTLKSFCQLVDPLYKGLEGLNAMTYVRNNHKDGEKYYWQLVSNSIIDQTQFAELIVYMPYKSELEEIQQMARSVDGAEMSKHYFIAMANDGDLPFIHDEGYYKNINVIRFEVPQEDKDFLTERVDQAGKLLIDFPSVVIASFDNSVHATIISA